MTVSNWQPARTCDNWVIPVSPPCEVSGSWVSGQQGEFPGQGLSVESTSADFTVNVAHQDLRRVSALPRKGSHQPVVQLLSHVWLCDSMDCSMPGFPILRYLPELAHTHVHWVNDAVQPSHPLSPHFFSSCLQSFPASGPFLMSQLFAAGSQSIGASASVLPTGLISLLSKGLKSLLQHQLESINS